MRLAQAGGVEELEEWEGSPSTSAAPAIEPSVDVPPVAVKADFAPLEKLCAMLSAVRDAARRNGDVAALAPARATPLRPEATPAAPAWPAEARL
ncbi:hypothetical protein X743_34435 [Mesorhizobium sp. LNHC252B00]|nr:hypothetical protein X743_34435 [Mesorhizobium sp. LNHC252B00]